MAIIAAAVIGGIGAGATLGSAAINADASQSSADAAANARIEEAKIMGLTSRDNTIQNAITMRLGIESQETVFKQQLFFANLADRRSASLEKRALNNELQMATQMYNVQIYQETLGHVENMAKIKLEAKQMGFEEDQLAKSFELDKMKLLEDNMVPTSEFMETAEA